jgi:hypothetical protein
MEFSGMNAKLPLQRLPCKQNFGKNALPAGERSRLESALTYYGLCYIV